MNINDPDYMALNKGSLITLRDAKSRFDITLVPLDDEARLYTVVIEVKDPVSHEIISKGIFYSHRNTARKFRLGSAMTFIQKILPELKTITVLTPAGDKGKK